MANETVTGMGIELNCSITEHQSQSLSEISYWVNGVITNIVVILGLVGNILTIVILSQRAMRSSTNYYLSALAVWDSIVLIITALLIGLPALSGHMMLYNFYVLPFIVSYAYPLGLIAQTATIWLTVSFTAERYIAVCHPLKAATMCTLERAKAVVIIVSIISALYNIPRWFEYRPAASAHPHLNTSIYTVARTSFGRNEHYLRIYYSWLYFPLMCIIPLLMLAILNTFLILAVRKSQRQRKDMNVKQSRENNVTIMLVSVVIVFIICQVPALVYNFAFAVENDCIDKKYGYMILSNLRNFLVNLNSAINFILYCALGQKFRRIFLYTFCKRCSCIHEHYTPMSGVYHHSAANQNALHHRYTSKIVDCRGKKPPESFSLNHSISTTQTTTTTRSSQESGFQEHVTSNRFSKMNHNGDRQVNTYTSMRHGRQPVEHPSGHEENESEDDLGFDPTMLPEVDKDMFPIYKMDYSSPNSKIAQME